MQMCFASNACTLHRLRASGVIESVAKALRNCSATRRKLGQFGSHLGPASWSWRWFLAAASRAYYPTVLAPPCCLPRLHARRVVALMPCARYRIMLMLACASTDVSSLQRPARTLRYRYTLSCPNCNTGDQIRLHARLSHLKFWIGITERPAVPHHPTTHNENRCGPYRCAWERSRALVQHCAALRRLTWRNTGHSFSCALVLLVCLFCHEDLCCRLCLCHWIM